MSQALFSLYKCPNCGEQNPPESIYFGECGTKLIKTCFHCSSKIPVQSKFCNICGARYEEVKHEFKQDTPVHVYTMPSPTEEGDILTDARDQQKYKMVTIGNQVWLAENFRFMTQGSFTYDGNNDRADTYGRLYTWEAAQKVAPPGWHVATRKDFLELARFCKSQGKGEVGTMLKSRDLWKDQGVFGPGKPGTDAVGFAAKPAGNRTSAGVFGYMGSFAYFWCADEENETRAYYRHLSYFTGAFQELTSKKQCAFSVRLVKNP